LVDKNKILHLLAMQSMYTLPVVQLDVFQELLQAVTGIVAVAALALLVIIAVAHTVTIAAVVNVLP
jgi:hypothetical protein